MKSGRRHRAAAAIALALACSAASAQLAPRGETVVIVGTRGSLESALQRKRDSDDIVDSVVAAEIHKLPDLSVGDALQRITGVQITRDRGEASVATVRGLIQVETTLNGREIFTAGNGRTLDFADLAAESLAGIDVYKTAAADRIEGGLGGVVDLRTRRPFDLRGDITSISARALRADLARDTRGQFSLLLGRRGAAAGGGELGLVLNLVLQDRGWREDQKSSGTPSVRRDLVPGRDIVVPSATSETTSTGIRRRNGASALLGWRPHAAFEAYAEAHFAELRTRQDSQQINVSAGTGFVPGSLELAPGSDDLRRITWTNAPLSVLSFARDTVDRTRQFAAGARFDTGAARIGVDLSHTRSFNHLFFSGPFFAGTAAQFTHDLLGRVPNTSLDGTDLSDPANLRYTGLAYRTRPLRGELLAARVDAEWPLDAGALERVTAGWRQARREADNAPGLVFGDLPLTGVTAADTPQRMLLNPYAQFLDGRATSIRNYLVSSLADARDPLALRRAFGIDTPLPTQGDPLGVWRIRERTDALYLQGGWRWPAAPVDGLVGLRVVHTRTAVDGAQSVPAAGTTAPIALDASSTDWLPNASLRWRAAPGLQWRAALSRTITRPDFNQLSPSLVLTPNPVDPALNLGLAGNPGLRPLRATNADLALERDLGRGHAVSLGVFWKRVDGFITTLSQPEEHGGQLYQVSRPHNATSAMCAAPNSPTSGSSISCPPPGAAWACRPTTPTSTAAPSTACWVPPCRCRTCRATART